MLLGKLVKQSLNAIGLDLQRLAYTPSFTLCGIKNLNIRTVLDIGANQGQFAAFARRHFPCARIISFEPLPGPFAKLQALAQKDSNLVPVNTAIGAEAGRRSFRLHTANSASSSFLLTTSRNEELYPQTIPQSELLVEVATLDGWAATAGITLEPELLVKLDVQGYEDRVITGGGHVFAQAAACVLEIGLDPLYVGQATFYDLVERLRAHGLAYAGNLDQVFGPDGAVVYLDAVFLRKAPAVQG